MQRPQRRADDRVVQRAAPGRGIEPLREGRDAYVSDGVRRALGRPPRTFAEFAKSTAAQGGWPS
ncbi:hypothetical protein DF19_04350 [Streptomyces olindensis]|nr:hypothetical protein DF19_04350 [Streptomyces olindensis]